MKKVFIISFLFLISLFTALATEPEIKTIKLDKTDYKPGDIISVSIEFTGKPIEIQSVEIISREYRTNTPKLMMQLLGDGKNIWVLQTNLPYDAPYGIYNVEVKAINKNGEEITSNNCEGCIYGKTGVFKFEVK